ncbi:MAG: VWA domain-containing protein [Protaetiibacter sp.]
MTVQYPLVLVAAVLVGAGLTAGYLLVERRRGRRLTAAGFTTTRRRGRHLPWILLIVGATLLTASLARPSGIIAVPRAAGTVMVVVDVSASMAADDADPTRLDAAVAAASALVEAQPDTVDVGVVAFSGGALTVQQPDADHTLALAALERLSPEGSTSLSAAILGALGAITGEQVVLAEDGTAPDLGYWGSATIVVYSDGEDTGPAARAAAAGGPATAGVHIDTVGVGTVEGTTLEIGDYRVTTALDEQQLEELAATTGGSYTPLSDASEQALQVELRLSSVEQTIELTGFGALLAVLLLVAGWAVAVARTGRLFG